MKIKETIGIDVSKANLDAHIHSNKCKSTFENSKKGFGPLIKWAYANNEHSKESILFVFEHIGLYSEKLADTFRQRKSPMLLCQGSKSKNHSES